MKITNTKKLENRLTLGVDIGSTTAKVVLIDNGEVIYEKYERHLSQVRQKTLEMIQAIEPMLTGREFAVAISGSAGLGLAEAARIPFVQEVYATGEVIRVLEPDTSVVIELGGEDAKVIFFKGGTDEHPAVPHRLPLRRVRKNRYSAPAESRRQQIRRSRQYLSGCGKPDHCRFGTGTEN